VSGSGGEADRELVVARKEDAADGVAMLELRDLAGTPLPGWQPGAHIDLLLGPGLVRQYSLCGAPADAATWRIAVLREPAGRGGSRHVHDVLMEGGRVRARGPRNHFALEPAGRYLFIAGGIGITPILPMIAAAEATGTPWTLTYGGRARSSMAFRDELRSRYGDRVLLQPQDEAGLLDLDALLGQPAVGTLVYCCGPEPLLAAVEARCASWPAGALHVERFAPRAGEAPARPAAAGAETEAEAQAEAQVEAEVQAEAFEVELAQSGLLIRVSAETSILRAVEAAGVQVLSSCTEGICGTCETAVLDGVPDHRDSLLTPAERAAGDTMMICVSRSATPRLVLDL
jgi:ferredoxin-NADP reductase